MSFCSGETSPGRQLLSMWVHTHTHTDIHTYKHTQMTSLPVFQLLTLSRTTWRGPVPRHDWTTSTVSTEADANQVRVSVCVHVTDVCGCFYGFMRHSRVSVFGLKTQLCLSLQSLQSCWCTHLRSPGRVSRCCWTETCRTDAPGDSQVDRHTWGQSGRQTHQETVR